jgi:hypothetical protein
MNQLDAEIINKVCTGGTSGEQLLVKQYIVCLEAALEAAMQVVEENKA